MNRRELLQTLDLVAPALAQENLVPIYQNFCFQPGTVYAFRDTLGIMAPCATADEFAVHGKTLMELLRASLVKEVEMELQNENVLVKVGRSKIKLPFFDGNDFLFREPEEEQWDLMLDIDKHLLRGIELCLTTSSNDNTMPALMGVTIVGGPKTHLYSCDGDAISRYLLDTDNTKQCYFTMPNFFCEALLKVAEKTGYNTGQLYVNGEWVIAEMSNAFRIFGRIIDNPDPVKFEAEIARVMKQVPEYVPIPQAMPQALSRARIIAEIENKATDVTINGGKIHLTTETYMGVVKDTIPLQGNHSSLDVKVNAKLVSRAISIAEEFAMQEHCTTYRTGDDFFLVMGNIGE